LYCDLNRNFKYMEPKEEEKTSTDFYGHNPPKPFMEMSFFF